MVILGVNDGAAITVASCFTKNDGTNRPRDSKGILRMLIDV